jgi:hypothetical protein
VTGTGPGILPEFFLGEAIESNRLDRLLPDWSIPLGAVYWVTPPKGPLAGGEGVSQLPLKDKAFLTFSGQNPPFELRPKTGVFDVDACRSGVAFEVTA